MACDYCEQRGIVVIEQFRNGGTFPQVIMCPKCEDIKAYSKYCKAEYGNGNTDMYSDIIKEYFMKNNLYGGQYNKDVAQILVELEEDKKVVNLNDYRKKKGK